MFQDFDYNSWWFSSLVFILYCTYQFIAYEFWRYYVYEMSILFIFLSYIFTIFDISKRTGHLSHVSIYYFFNFVRIYFIDSCIYFNRDHKMVNKNRFNKILHQLSNKIFATFNSVFIFCENKMYFTIN